MSEKSDFALVPRPPGALEKADPGAKRILSDMVADALALAKQGPPRNQRPLRIVSVDDEDWRLELVEVTISDFFKGVTVQSFRDAEEAWQELSRTDPDLLITDDIMGNLNGEDIVQRLADRKVAYPIIVINGCGPERDQWVLDCVKRGVNVTLLRAPYSLASLVRALESGLRISRDTKRPVEMAGHCAPAPGVDAEALYQEACAYDALEKRDYAEMIRLFRKAAEGGHAEASMRLWAICLSDDCPSVPRDEEQAFYWLRKAAEQGCEYAPLQLGHCYNKGCGVPQDYARAVHWYRKAAEQGDARAQFNLGHCYEHGQGVRQDISEAVTWYRKAAEQGHTSSQENLGACYANGRAVIEDAVEAYQWVKLAEERGCDGATLTLAMMEGIFLSPEQFREAERRYHQLRSSKGLDAPRKID